MASSVRLIPGGGARYRTPAKWADYQAIQGRALLVGQAVRPSQCYGARQFVLPDGGELEVATERILYGDGSATGWETRGLSSDVSVPGSVFDVFAAAMEALF